MNKLTCSNIVTAFDKTTIGTKVVDEAHFYVLLWEAIDAHDFSSDKTPGQAVLTLDEKIIQNPHWYSCVSGGIGRKTRNPDDYIVRNYRGQPHMFLKRKFAEPVKSVRAVVYTRNAYLLDPDVVSDQDEGERIRQSDATHVLVAVLGETGVPSTVSPYRFVANLAGGNLDYQEGKMTYRELVELARKVKSHSDEWTTVAD
jgi:hypothetical protein